MVATDPFPGCCQANGTPVPREEVAQLGTGRVLGVPDDRGRHGRMLDPVLADAIHPSHQRLGDLGAQDLALTHQLQEVRPLQPEQAARLGGAEIGKDRGPQQQRQLAERIARAVGEDPLFAARDVLEDVDAALEYPVEARRLALGQEQFVLAQANIGGAGRQRGAFLFGELGEERDAADQVGSDHRINVTTSRRQRA